MSNNQKNCSCSGAPTLIFACSGAAEVGAIADQAARKLSAAGKGKMFCLAGVGGKVDGIMKTTAAAENILAIDGCPLNCVKHTLEQAGFNKFRHLRLAELGMVKGQATATAENIAAAVAAAEVELSK